MLTDFNKIYSLEIDLKNLEVIHNSQALYANTDLNTSTMLIKLSLDEKALDITDKTVTAYIKTGKDQNVTMQRCEILEADEGIVGLDFKNSALKIGTNIFFLEIKSENEEIINSPLVSYKVVELFDITDGVEGENDTTILRQLITEVEVGRGSVESLRNEIGKEEAIRKKAEAGRKDTENIRIQAENLRVEAENSRVQAEDERVERFETAQVTRETKFEEAQRNREELFKANEATRAINETARQQSETTRENNEAIRIDTEATRDSSESTRQKEEAKRSQAESLRAKAEEQRILSYEEIKRNNATFKEEITRNNTTFKEEMGEQFKVVENEIDSFMSGANELGNSLTNKINQATNKNSELQNSLNETKKFIDGLDESRNIPQIALDVNELKNNLNAQDASVETSENVVLEGATNSVSNFTLYGRYEKTSAGELLGVENARIGVKGGKNLWDMKGSFDSKFDYNQVISNLTNGISIIPYYAENGDFICRRGALSETWGQKIRVKPHTNYNVCFKLVNAGHGVMTHIYGSEKKIKQFHIYNTSLAIHTFNSGNNTEIIIGFCNGHGADWTLYECRIREIAVYEYDGTTTNNKYVYEESKRNEFVLKDKIPSHYNDYPLLPLYSSPNNLKKDTVTKDVLYKSVFTYRITGDEDVSMGIYGKTGTEQIQLAIRPPFLTSKNEIYGGNGALRAMTTNKELYVYNGQVDMRDSFKNRGDGVGNIYGYNKGYMICFALSYKTLGISEEDYKNYKTAVFFEKFREWLKKEEIEVIFSLTSPIEVPLNNIGTFFIYENSEMYIEDIEGISPTMSFYYKKSIKGSIDSLVNEVEKIKRTLIEHIDYLIDNDFRITMLELGL